MKSLVINKYIDNKISRDFTNCKDVNGIILSLKERIKKTEATTNRYKGYIIFFAKKRIDDLLFVKDKFCDLPDQNIVNLMKLKDKLIGFEFQDVDIRDRIDCEPMEYEVHVSSEITRTIF